MIEFDRILRRELNDCLSAWGHALGPINRPEFRAPIDFGLRHRGALVAVVAADTLIRPTSGFDRSSAFELSRLCAARPDICRAALRLWREFAYPEIADLWGTSWAISYQDAARHAGHLYRFDGWRRINFTRSGRDPRAAGNTIPVRNKVVWGWTSDRLALAARAAQAPDAPRWAA